MTETTPPDLQGALDTANGKKGFELADEFMAKCRRLFDESQRANEAWRIKHDAAVESQAESNSLSSLTRRA